MRIWCHLAGWFAVLCLAVSVKGQLPSSFDWRAQGACTPPKMVQACYDSTWAFATTAAMESAILIQDGLSTDLAEQWLISCNIDGLDCQDGGWRHGLSYYQFMKDVSGDTGPVWETDFPFDESGSNVPCQGPYPHQMQHLLDNWRYVGDANSVPGIEAIKQAIMDSGPVVAGVYGSAPAYYGYSGGILETCASGAPDRAVVLVGWDDNQGQQGVWFLRESWGTFWGEGGYMRIAYGCNNVGYAAARLEYPGVHDLSVQPYNTIAGGQSMISFSGRGPVGGPFAPDCQGYTLTNTGADELHWVATSTQNWIDLSPSAGVLAGHESILVSACLNTNASTLPVGQYTDTLTFLNTTAGRPRKRFVTLAVDQIDSLTEYFQDNDNDLDHVMLTFVPDGSPDYYSLCVEAITELPTDSTGATPLPNVGHNKCNTVNCPTGTAVSLYGVSYSTLYVSTNGYITFTEPDTDHAESLPDHFRLPRVSALFDGLYVLWPITCLFLEDRVALTYERVTQDLYPDSLNRFQVEMFYDGRIRLSYLGMDCPTGIVGLSAGQGLLADFVESDLSAHADLCGYDYDLPDSDLDGDVDQADFGHFQLCLGSEVPLNAHCFRMDLSHDHSVDGTDTAMFIDCMSGPGVPAASPCGR